jgi:hypothetical protein
MLVGGTLAKGAATQGAVLVFMQNSSLIRLLLRLPPRIHAIRASPWHSHLMASD